MINFIKGLFKKDGASFIEKFAEHVNEEEHCINKRDYVAKVVSDMYHKEKVQNAIGMKVVESGEIVIANIKTTRGENGIVSEFIGDTLPPITTTSDVITKLKLATFAFTCDECKVKTPLGECNANRPPLDKIFHQVEEA
ncbi:MAG: hypothetical protein FWC00_00270 [Firmicutes bacterium]|nr:hypothetical protein [Bacillota bacterium]